MNPLFIVLMRQQINDSMIIGIGAAHAGAPAVYYIGGVRHSISQSSRDTRPETHQQY